MPYTIGLDFGTNSVRCLIVETSSGEEIATAVDEYQTGEQGIILDSSDHNLARQHPADYLTGIEATIRAALRVAAKKDKSFKAEGIIGIGIDTTASTPMPVTREGKPLCLLEEFEDNPNAYAWLWKDHTAFAEAREITKLAEKKHPEYLKKCGGTYSSEWFFSKILRCLRVDPKVFDAAYTWVEYCDYIPAVLKGDTRPDQIKPGRCAAGHKAMYNTEWGGLPSKDFLAELDPKLGELRERLYEKSYTIDERAGNLAKEWAAKLGLPAGIPIAVGAIDAHLGAVGSGVGPGKLVKIIGTSTCDIMVADSTNKLPDIPGLCGIVDGSVLPGYYGLEAGQSAVGDIFNWYVNYLQPGGPEKGSHEALTKKAEQLKPGQSGLLALDWNNGNRNILVDQRLTGLLIGQTLHTRPEEIYRALIEATAFGGLMIISRLEEYGVKVEEVINCGGIAEKNPMVMQIYADVMGREMKIARSAQACALGAAIAGAVVAGKAAGGYESVPEAQASMCGIKDITYKPIAENQKVYKKMFGLYRNLHDAFGLADYTSSLAHVMKDMLEIKALSSA